SQFAALASHELRTPVAAIYGAVQTLDERAGRLSPEREAELRRMLTQQSKRLFELVENLLDLSRLEADSLLISPTEIEVRERLEEMVEVVVNGDREVRIEVPDGLRAMVDAQAFDRTLSNLLANAVRHGAPPFLVSAASGHGELAVTIEDRGSGV